MNDNYAIVSKIKSMFSKRLTLQDYNLLANERNLAGIINYLKNKTVYNNILINVDEKKLRREEFEYLIKNDLYYRVDKIFNYILNKDDFIYKVVLLRIEKDILLEIVYSLFYQNNRMLISKIPFHFKDKLSFNLKELIKSKNIEDICKNLESTKYHHIFKSFINQNEIAINKLEREFNNFYVNNLIKLINQFSNFKVKNLKDILLAEIELNNLRKIYRLKKYYKVTNEYIKNSMINTKHRFNNKIIDNLILKGTDLLTVLKNSSYRNFINIDSDEIEDLIADILKNISIKNIHSSNDKDVVVLAYISFLKIEILNLIDVIEGVRYQIGSGKIMENLIN